jgi:hypothetical protein
MEYVTVQTVVPTENDYAPVRLLALDERHNALQKHAREGYTLATSVAIGGFELTVILDTLSRPEGSAHVVSHRGLRALG